MFDYVSAYICIMAIQKKNSSDSTGWNDKIVILNKTTLQRYFKTFIEKITSGNLIMS